MSGLSNAFGAGQQANQTTQYTQLQLQTSALGVPMTLLYGVCRTGVNLGWYGGFQQVSGAGSKPGAIPGKNSANFTYKANVIAIICEGPITGVNRIWLSQAFYAWGSAPLAGWSLFQGYIGGTGPTVATNGQTTSGNVLQFGSTAGILPGMSALDVSAPDTQIRIGTAVLSVTPTTVILNDNVVSTVANGDNIQFSGQAAWSTPVAAQQRGYSRSAYFAISQLDLGSSAQMPNINAEVYGILCNSVNAKSDADPSQVLIDMLTDPAHGVGFPASKIDTLTQTGIMGAGCFQNYCLALPLLVSMQLTGQQPAAQVIDDMMTALNCELVWNGGLLTVVPYGDGNLTNSSGIGGNYVPVLTSRWTFTNADFVLDPSGGSNTPPQSQPAWNRREPSKLINHLKVEYADFDNGYNTSTVEVKSQSLIDRTSSKILRTKTASGLQFFRGSLTNAVYYPIISASLMLQREGLMNTCTFATDFRFFFLDPMDCVTVPDGSTTGGTKLVRIKQITQNDDDSLSFQCEEVVTGMGTLPNPLNKYAVSVGYEANTGVVANAINDIGVTTSPQIPLIYQASTGLTGRSAQDQIYFAASPQNADPNWGGCFVMLSLDAGTTYNSVGMISRVCRQGTQSGTQFSNTWIGTPANPDTTNTPTYVLAMSGGVLESFSNSAADAGASVFLVDTELVFYTTASFVSANTYTLKRLDRAKDGTIAATHASGAAFNRLDTAVFVWTMPASRYAGVALHFKFPSFNVFGQNVQSLSTCTDFIFTPS